ncbi:hypothetical protein [Prochlorococcus sp. MIT 1300]|uniref:hypothetical protein n=1 Tax=Prochlorococcus sp. MIT 1300 TaxID=3096218 RepID=UPI002A753D16|nr:hypothetical protein [Prochlorococcus sp. MIT 1300]
MSSLTIKVSAKADAMIAQLQKEVFNRRRKKITAEGVVESLVESGAKSQSDKRYAASWKNLIKDIEKAAKVSEEHGNKPPSISAEEWALILSHRTRKGTTTKKAAKSPKLALKKTTVKKPASKKAIAKRMTKATPTKAVGRPAKSARKTTKAVAVAAK